MLHPFRWFAALLACATQLQASTGVTCSPAAVGLGPAAPDAGKSLSAPDSLKHCGVAVLRGAVSADIARGLFEAFLALEPQQKAALSHGSVREQRAQFHLPFAPPFDALPLLGQAGELGSPLAGYLGDGFLLDLITVVVVPAGAAAQDPHRDTPLVGSVAAHIPLQALDAEFAPLGFCVGSHVMPKEEASVLMKEAILWRKKGESSQQAKRRLYCGGRQRTTVHNITVPAEIASTIRVRDGRLGATVSIGRLGATVAETLPWQAGDEITHVNSRLIADGDEWQEALAEATAGGSLEVRLERPIAEADAPPPFLAVGAPLNPGDVVLYDSRTWHWGMANTAAEDRLVLYVNFKSGEGHGGVHPESRGTSEMREARQAFRQRLIETKRQQGLGHPEL